MTVDYHSRLLSRQQAVYDDPSLPDELLYGRAGYLYALLYVRRHLGEEAVSSDIIRKVSLSFTCTVFLSCYYTYRHVQYVLYSNRYTYIVLLSCTIVS